MLGRLTWTDFGLVLLLAIPASAMPDTAPRAAPHIEDARVADPLRLVQGEQFALPV